MEKQPKHTRAMGSFAWLPHTLQSYQGSRNTDCKSSDLFGEMFHVNTEDYVTGEII